MKLNIHASKSFLSGSEETLKKVYAHFSFRDKAAESQIHRFKKTIIFKERNIAAANDGTLPDEYLAWKEKTLKEMREAVIVHACSWRPGPRGTVAQELIVPTGLVSSLLEYCTDNNLQIDVTDSRNFDLGRRMLTGAKPPTLRKPQVGAIQTVTADNRGPLKGLGLVRLATGVGKTALAQELIRALGLRAIFLVPSLPILKQTVKRYEDAFGKKNVKTYGGGSKDIGYVTIATYQSVYKGDPEDFKDIDVVIADECHHVSADTFYDVMMNKLGGAVWRIGLTAFEERADGSTMLIEAAVGPVIYKYDAPEAIRDGFLATPTFMIYDVWRTQGQWTQYKMKGKVRTAVAVKHSEPYDKDNDLLAYRNWVVGNDILNNFIQAMTAAFVEDGKSILILVDEIEHGERLMKLIPDAGFATGGSKDNERLMKEFNARRLKVLIGTSTLGEGADTVPVDVLINLQGGASKSRTLQADGRALRNETDENGIARKPTSLIIDFNFPLCKILERHSKVRESVHKTMGEIHRGTIK